MDSDQFLKDIQGKNVNFLIGAGASFGVVPTLWMESINKSFEDLLTSKDFDENQKKVLYFIWFELWIRKTKIIDFDLNNLYFKKSFYFPLILSGNMMFICKSLIPMVIKLDLLRFSLWFVPIIIK